MTDHSEAAAKRNKKKKKKKIKKYSRAWWRIYRAKQRKKRALMARKRALMKRQKVAQKADNSGDTTLALVKDASGQPTKATVKVRKSRGAKPQPVAADNYQPNILPTGEIAPVGWQRNGSGMEFRVSDSNGVDVGSADLKVVSPSMGVDDQSGRNKTVGGVPTVALRRTVIDKMIRDNGWVVNDYQKEVDGKKVYVVIAQSPGAGGVQSRVFYFMEAEGRVYSLATSSSAETAEKVAADSEKVLNSIGRGIRPVQQASAAAMR